MAGQLHLQVCDGILSRRQARRLCREFDAVGVHVEPARLQQISSGAPTVGNERIDVSFALVATSLTNESRHSTLLRARRRVAHWLLVAAMILLSLAVLIALTTGILTLVQPTFGAP